MAAVNQSPASLGFRMPAEWEEHEATWIGWPHNKSDWPGKFSTIPWMFGEIVRKLSAGEIVRIIVNSKDHEASARRVLKHVHADMSQVEFFRFPTNRGWTRDFGPMFVRRDTPESDVERRASSLYREVAVTGFRFNAWAKYSDWKKDQHIHKRGANALGLRLFHPTYKGNNVVLEGGALDVNGCGTLLTTEECLLDQETQVRNPGFTRHDIEKIFADYLGATNVVWLGKGIAGDDTHGHVDDLCRFVNANTVVLCTEENPMDANYCALQENRDRLDSARLEDGSRLNVVPLPMPTPLFFDDVRVPASYANFYIANACVLVPTFNDVNDRIALGILSELFSDRPVIGIHAVDLVWGLGTLHCLTQQQPAL
ncbi:MAG: agmatine deiminase family protein [Ignavibacteriae bacterium]|nr:agmatine deiminase family protein [Ignavibacteriota bacterium]